MALTYTSRWYQKQTSPPRARHTTLNLRKPHRIRFGGDRLALDVLPPGPRLPVAVQTAAWITRPWPFMERCAARYGDTFTMRLVGEPPFVMISHPAAVKEVFTGPPELLHVGEVGRILLPMVGANSVLLLDEEVSAQEAQRYTSLLSAESPQAVLEATRWLCEIDTRHVDAPALIFAVRADPLVPLKGIHALAEAIGATIVTLENTGHGIPLNPVWANVTAQIDPWLRTTTAQKRAYDQTRR
jgi:pimeloyl-ACP methyl ester carboxylesterase